MLRTSIRAFSTQPRLSTNYGFIGLGLMGQHMARHVYNQLEPSDKLYVYDVDPKHTTQFLTEVTSQTPQNAPLLTPLNSLKDFTTEVDSQLDFIVTMVPEGKHVKSVVSNWLVIINQLVIMIQVSKPLSWILQQSISQPQETYTNWLSQVFLNLTLLILQCPVVLQEQEREHCHLCCPEKPMMILIQV